MTHEQCNKWQLTARCILTRGDHGIHIGHDTDNHGALATWSTQESEDKK